MPAPRLTAKDTDLIVFLLLWMRIPVAEVAVGLGIARQTIYRVMRARVGWIRQFDKLIKICPRVFPCIDVYEELKETFPLRRQPGQANRSLNVSLQSILKYHPDREMILVRIYECVDEMKDIETRRIEALSQRYLTRKQFALVEGGFPVEFQRFIYRAPAVVAFEFMDPEYWLFPEIRMLVEERRFGACEGISEFMTEDFLACMLASAATSR
ncbi:hypothetical protein KQI84_08645 [bacterium]|nr:hypothetical protein [bacterium]